MPRPTISTTRTAAIALAAAMLVSDPSPVLSSQTAPYGGQRPSPRAAVQACAADIARLCAGVQPGGGRIIGCLAANSQTLSPACLELLLRARALLGS